MEGNGKRMMTIRNCEDDELHVYADGALIGRVAGWSQDEVPEEYLADGTRLALDSRLLAEKGGIHEAVVGIGAVTMRTYRFPEDEEADALVKDGGEWREVDRDWLIVVDRVAALNAHPVNDYHLPVGADDPDMDVRLVGRGGRPVTIRINPERLSPR